MAVQRTLIGNIKGPKGDKGDTGDTGARGAGATVTIGSVTTTAYGGNANVTNSGTATDAVFDFVLPQGAPGEMVTDMQDLTLSSMTQPSVQFPTPSVGDDGKTLFGKITKWFSDMAALVATKFNAANVVNNLTTTSSGYALDARMGKTLQDQITSLNDSLGIAQRRFFHFTNSDAPSGYRGVQIFFAASSTNPILVQDADGNCFVVIENWSTVTTTLKQVNPIFLNNAGTLQAVMCAKQTSTLYRLKLTYAQTLSSGGGLISLDGVAEFRQQSFAQQ